MSDLVYEEVQCLICFKEMGFVAFNHDSLYGADSMDFPILCKECKERTE